jgi:hypothetical protein
MNDRIVQANSLAGAVKIVHAAFWLALTLWVSVLITAAIAAMNSFTKLPALQIELKDYSAIASSEHGRLAAGMVMDGVFRMCDRVQLLAVPIALITLILQFTSGVARWKTISNLIRIFAIVCAAGLFLFYITSLSPQMQRSLHAYWDSAASGKIDEAQAYRAAFTALHPVASRLLQTNLVLLLVAIGASAVALAPPQRISSDLTLQPG